MAREKLKQEETLAGYDRWAATYDAVENPLVAATGWVLDRDPLGCAGLDVIELGCGTGRNAARVLAEGARSYTGVDGSKGMLEVARRRVNDARAAFLEADLAAPWEPPRRFELALVVLVLEHVTDLAAFAQTLARVVAPGGHARIVDLHPDRIAAGSVAHFQAAAGEVVFPSVAHPIEQIRAELDRAGLTTSVREWPADGALIAASPKAAKHRGLPLVVDITAARR